MVLDTWRRALFAEALVALALVLLAACTQAAAISAPVAGSDEETSILEEGGNINLALREAQKGMGPSIVGDPTAVYGKIMTYSAALKAAGSRGLEGDSQAWKFDRLVYLYLFEGDIFDPDPRTRNVTDMAQKVVILDAETGAPFREITHRAVTKLDVSQFLPLTFRDNTKGVPPREIKGLNRPPPIPVARATPAPKPPEETATSTAGPTRTPLPRTTATGCSGREEVPPCGPGVEIGKPYPYIQYTHCGIRSAYFDGRRWIADPILSVDNVNPPPGWGNPSDKGSMELVAEDLARFTSGTGLTAEFRPLPEGAEYPWRPCL